jgi:hypothetical protein
VAFVLQGDPARIKAAIQEIAKGDAKSSDVKVKTTTAKVDPQLKTFTVLGWTSTSRNITNPYNLVFTLSSSFADLGAYFQRLNGEFSVDFEVDDHGMT